MRRYILLLIIATIGATGCAAQAKIDKLINSLEKKNDVETTYTERRSPKKKKPYRISRILTFSEASYYSQFTRAFEEERENTVSAVKTRLSMTYRFEDDKGTSSYTLSNTNGSAPYTLVMSWTSSDAAKLESYHAIEGDDNILTCIDSGRSNFNRYCASASAEYLDELNELALINAEAQRLEAEKKAKIARRMGAEARKKGAEARKQAAEARKQAAEARRDAAKARAKARREAAKNRKNSEKVSQVIYCSNGLTIYQE